MNHNRTHKKNLIISFKNASDELKELLKETYPDGYKDYIQRFVKPNGETIFVVPVETEDTAYMIKFDVKIDTTYTDEDVEKDYFDEEVDKADSEFAPLQEAIDKEEETPGSHTEREIRHGDYEEEETHKRRKPHDDMSDLGAELEEAFSEDADDEESDDYDDDEEDEPNPDDEYEPTDEELNDIDSEIFANAEIPPEELARMEAEKAAEEPKKKGRPRKDSAAAAPAEPKKKGRPRKNQDK